MVIFAETTDNDCIKDQYPLLKAHKDQNYTIIWKLCEMGLSYYSLIRNGIQPFVWYENR